MNRSSAASQSGSSLEPIALQVIPVLGEESGLEQYSRILRGLARKAAPFSLEIAGTRKQRLLIIRCQPGNRDFIASQINAVWPSARIQLLKGEADPLRQLKSNPVIGRSRLKLRFPPALPLEIPEAAQEWEGIRPVIQAFSGLAPDEVSIVQVQILGPAPEDWAAVYRQESLQRLRNESSSSGLKSALSLGGLGFGLGLLVITIWSFLNGIWIEGILLGLAGMGLLILSLIFNRGSGLDWSRFSEEAVQEKINQPAVTVDIRLLSGGHDRDSVTRQLQQLIAAYDSYSRADGNQFQAIRADFDLEGVEKDAGLILGDRELAALWHLPGTYIPDLLYVEQVHNVLPDIQAVSDPHEGLYLGTVEKTGGGQSSIFLPKTAVTRTHALLLGRTRMGKSNALEHIFHCAAQERDRAVFLIDPHDDSVMRLLNVIPADRQKDVVYLNFADQEQVPAFNPLDIQLLGDAEQTSEAFVEVAHALFGKFWGPRMEVVLRNAINALCLANTLAKPEEQFTLIDVLHFLLLRKSNLRGELLKRILPEGNLLGETIIDYFKYEYDMLEKSFQERVVMPVLSKLRQFQMNSQVLSIFGQPSCSFHLGEAIAQRKIILVRTGKTVITDQFSSFMGSLLLNFLRKSIFQQSRLPADERVPVSVFIDESQTFSGINYGSLLSEIAKFGGNVILTTQGSHIGRRTASDEIDDPFAWDRILDNVDTLLIFRLSGATARALSEGEFIGRIEAADLINLPQYEAFLRYTRDRRVQGPFRLKIAPPLVGQPLSPTVLQDIQSRHAIPAEKALRIAGMLSRRIARLAGLDPLGRPFMETLTKDGQVLFQEMESTNYRSLDISEENLGDLIGGKSHA